MNLHRWLAAASVVLALAGCAQVTTDQRQAPYAPYSPEPNGEYPRTGVVTEAAEVAAVRCSRQESPTLEQGRAVEVLDLKMPVMSIKTQVKRGHRHGRGNPFKPTFPRFPRVLRP
jgi:hypothetical protein